MIITVDASIDNGTCAKKRVQKLVQVSVVLWYPDQDVMPELYGGDDWNRSASTLVPTLDRGQPRPRLLVPNAYSLSPTRRSSMPMRRGTN